jgi:hypothetical protein
MARTNKEHDAGWEVGIGHPKRAIETIRFFAQKS